MVDPVSVVEQFHDSFLAKYTNRLLHGHLSALNAISRCRTLDSGELRVRCTECEQAEWRPLSKGFRRVRDYGFLHGNAKMLLCLVQLVLRVMVEPKHLRPRPVFQCPRCKAVMQITAFRRPVWLSG